VLQAYMPPRNDPLQDHQAGLPEHQFAPDIGVLVKRDPNLTRTSSSAKLGKARANGDHDPA
jgi:hypothetical protein